MYGCRQMDDHIRENVLSLEDVCRNDWDVIVVGGGTAGSPAAKISAEMGTETLILEKERLERIGDKVCGDAVGKHHFDRTGIDPPKGRDLGSKFSGIRVFSPNHKTTYLVPGHGYGVNRHEFGYRLLKDALDAGARIAPNTTVKAPVIEDGVVNGVIVEDGRGERRSVEASIVIDASGWRGVIRRDAASLMEEMRTYSLRDLAYCYREIWSMDEPLEEHDLADMYPNNEAAPGGYWWFFPKEEGSVVNVGLGLQMSTGKNPKKHFDRYIAPAMFKGVKKVLDVGAGIVPTRRPLSTLVWDGVCFVGDAASTANPLHGGGIGQSMYSGVLAGKIAAEAALGGDISRGGLWEYNLSYMDGYGKRGAVLDVFRTYLQTLNNQDLNFGMEHRLIDESDLRIIGSEAVNPISMMDKARQATMVFRKPQLLRNLYRVGKVMKRVKDLYSDYPDSPGKLGGWAERVNKVFSDYRRSLGLEP
jgi:digeranylgeranylglycerophospholipid reductase